MIFPEQGHHLPDHDRSTFLLKRSLEKMQKPWLLSNSVLKDVQRSLWKMDIDGWWMDIDGWSMDIDGWLMDIDGLLMEKMFMQEFPGVIKWWILMDD